MNMPVQEIRSGVSRDYAKLVSAPNPLTDGSIAALAGYSAEELSSLPADAAANSFACGNPLSFATVKPGEVVLDLGSGVGVDLLLAAARVGPSGRVIGVDMTDEMIAKANANIRAKGHDNVEVRKGLIEALPVESGSVDWVISNCVINLSPEKHKVFREIHRVLKPGGAMLVSDLIAKDMPEELLLMPALHSSCIAGAIDEERYLDGLREVGMTEVKVLDRLFYEREQIESYADLAFGETFIANPQMKERIPAFVRMMEGNIWSAKVYGKKPL